MTDHLELSIQGMTCDGCVNSLKRALSRVRGVREVVVELESARAIVTGTFDVDSVVKAVHNAGYSLGATR